MFSQNVVARDGEYTKTVYTLVNINIILFKICYYIFIYRSVIYAKIKDERFDEAIRLLNNIPEATTTRAGLSLLGHCYYQCQEFLEAATCYEQLCILIADVAEYKYTFHLPLNIQYISIFV